MNANIPTEPGVAARAVDGGDERNAAQHDGCRQGRPQPPGIVGDKLLLAEIRGSDDEDVDPPGRPPAFFGSPDRGGLKVGAHAILLGLVRLY